MNYRQLYQRICNLDRLYLAWDELSELARKHEGHERKAIERAAAKFRARYNYLVADRRRVHA